MVAAVDNMAAVDICMHIDVLQAKIVARMHHPRRHPWKVLIQAAIRMHSPLHLGIALPISMAAPLPHHASATRLALFPRHADYHADYLGAVDGTFPRDGGGGHV